MEDRKTRIAKLSERLNIKITERLDKDYKEFSHQLYPQTVSKSVFIETILEYGLDNLQTLRAIIKARSEEVSANE
jgi:hypothetical protein